LLNRHAHDRYVLTLISAALINNLVLHCRWPSIRCWPEHAAGACAGLATTVVMVERRAGYLLTTTAGAVGTWTLRLFVFLPSVLLIARC
jgi:hypothetical protein